MKEVPGNISCLSSLNECEWQGVICGENDEVRGIHIAGQRLQGTLLLTDTDADKSLLWAFPIL